MKKVKKCWVAILCLLSVSFNSISTIAMPVIEQSSIQQDSMVTEAVSTGIIGEEAEGTYSTRSTTPKGACTLYLRPIGAGLLDCEWSIFMSTHKISYIEGLVQLNFYDDGYSDTEYLDVIRKVPVWRSTENGVEQTFFNPGTHVSGQFFGTITLNGTFEYPFSTFTTRTVTIQ